MIEIKMYSDIEIEFIWKNCTTGEEWDYCVSLFTWLMDDPDFVKNINKEKVDLFQETALNQLQNIIRNGKA